MKFNSELDHYQNTQALSGSTCSQIKSLPSPITAMLSTQINASTIAPDEPPTHDPNTEVSSEIELLSQSETNYIDGVLTSMEEQGDGGGELGGGADAETDPLYDQAVAIVLKSRRASPSFVQRDLRISYKRAARLIEQMEKAGIVAPMQNNGNREVIAPARSE